MINYQAIIYPYIRQNLIADNADNTGIIKQFTDICNDMSLNVTTLEACNAYAKKFYDYMCNNHNISKFIDINFTFSVNTDIANRFTLLRESELSNATLSADSFPYNKYGVLLSYIKEYPYDTEIVDEHFSNIENNEVTEDIYNSFITLLNNIVISLNNNFQDTINSILVLINEHNIPCILKDNYDELLTPLRIYNLLTDKKTSSMLDVDMFINYYLQLLDDKADDNFLQLFINVINNNDTANNIVINVNEQDSKRYVSALIKSEIDDKTVKQFILEFTSDEHRDKLTIKDIYGYNRRIIKNIQDVVLNISNKDNAINAMAEALNKNITFITDFENHVNTKKISDIIKDLSDNIKTVKQSSTGLLGKNKTSIPKGIVQELCDIIANVKELNLKEQLQYIKFIGKNNKQGDSAYINFITSLKRLCDKTTISTYFLDDTLWDSNINPQTIINALTILLTNEKTYPYITTYYYIQYIFIKK